MKTNVPHWTLLFLILPIILIAGVCVGSKPSQNIQTVYNHTTPDGASLDDLVHRIYGSEFRVVDVSKDDGFLPAKVSEGTLPSTAVSKLGHELEGYVLILYLITDKGRVAKPIVVKTTEKALDQITLEAMDGWRFVPASFKGKPVWSTAAQEFVFKKKEK